ncbi:metallophosphoesterase family protein [Saliphagus infecundisoli]|uniref:Metallophosphoesterase family protein n=1 Tax=Saliphagus infecundisoli TaxID=1849069 RepID=A0ABD5QAF6_9EURY|nr:metallophosphoesterase [Saliphagus infecundisoli]
MGRLAQPTAEELTTIAVIGDPHIPRESEDTLKLYQADIFLERVVEDVNARDVDTALFVGDITMDGFNEEYKRFDRIVEPLDVPWAAIPGNHDVWKTYDEHDSPSIEVFEDRYTSDGLPFVIDHGDVQLIALDSSSHDDVNDTHAGTVDDDQLEWLDEQLAAAMNPVVALHHVLPAMIEQFEAYSRDVDPDLSPPPVLENTQPLIDVLQKHEVSLVLTGHLHIPSIAQTDRVREVNAPATSTFPPAYLVLEIGPDGTIVRYIPLGDSTEARTAFTRRSGLRPKAEALSVMAASRIASFPLVDEIDRD